jgi:peptidoglycan/xylan/chitin deacetylase (PgdA/CDA1 family)
MDVAITFDGISDTATLQRLVGALGDRGLRATFFVPPPELPAAAQVETVLLRNNQLLASEADRSEWATWLDPNFRQLSRDQRTFVRNIGVCPTFFRSPDRRTSPMMATGARRHGMTVVSSDVQANGRGDPARLVRRVLTRVRSGSIIALQLDSNAASNTAAVVEALPQILQGMLARGLHVVPLDQLLHTAPYAARC